MGKSRTLELDCPCCGARLHVDAESAAVLFSEEAKQPARGFSFAEELDRVQRQKEQADEMFQKAFQDEAERKKLLERKFEEGRRQASKGGVTRPRNPLDFD